MTDNINPENITPESAVVTYQIEIPLERIGDLLCCAIEGGSNYWYSRMALYDGDPAIEGNRIKWADSVIEHGWSTGWTLRIKTDAEDGNRLFDIDWDCIQKALVLMAAGSDKPSGWSRKHFADFLEENEDATTGDVFLQLCCFGEVLYG